GKLDTLISFDNSVTLDKKLTECGVKHDYLIFPNSDHGLDDDPIMSKLAEAMFFKYMFEYLI
ncbi:MAG: alpha/beta hydrolase, partial [Clostridia bacterium]|nr:alpha/beta hydrolase [Clostridia bacterium]